MRTARAFIIGVLLIMATHKVASAETAIGAVFGYPGNAGLSLRFDNMPINAAWSEDFIHGTVDKWIKKTPMGSDGKLAWYLGVGVDAGIPFDDNEEFFLAGRVPIGLQLMFTPKLEGFGEVAAGLQVLDETDFYWSSSIGIRFLLGGK
jgi:hypothetical protein